MYFGNTSYYGYTQLSEQNETTKNGSVFINFLESSTVYYFQLTGWDYNATCTGAVGWYNNTWTTTAEVPYLNATGYALTGTVYDSSGGSHAPAGVLVEVQCVYAPRAWAATGLTNGLGQYSIDVAAGYTPKPPYTFCNQFAGPGRQAMLVSVLNGGSGNTLWQGWWNETVEIWVPQVVNFYLPANLLGPYLPEELEFTSSPYVTLSFSQSVSTTDSYSAEAGGNGGGMTSSFTATQTGSATGTNLETWVKYDASGQVEFNALDRVDSIQNTSFYGAILHSTTSNLVTDPIAASSVTPSESFGSGLWYWYNITAGVQRGGGVNISGSVTYTSGLDISLDVSIGLPGGLGAGASVPIQFTESTTQTYTNVFSFNVDNTGNVMHGFRAYAQGGSNTNTGIILHVWQLT